MAARATPAVWRSEATSAVRNGPMTTADGKFLIHDASRIDSPTTSASPATVAPQRSPGSPSRRTRSAAALSSLMSSGSQVVHDGQSFAQADHVEQPVDRRGRSYDDEARPGCGGRVLGLDHSGEALRVHERDLAQVQHDLLTALDRAGELCAEHIDGGEVDVPVDGDHLCRVLRGDIDAEFLIRDQAMISAYWTA